MAANVRESEVTFHAATAVTVDGVDLPSGEYRGYMKQLGINMMDGQTSWVRPSFRLALNEKQVSEIRGRSDFFGLELNATSAVADGRLKARY